MGIGETLRQALAKLVIRAAGKQAKTACGNLQLCAGPEAGIEGKTRAVGKQKLDRTRQRRSVYESRSVEGEEEESESVGLEFNNLTIETLRTEEDTREGLETTLEVEVDGGVEGEDEREDRGDGNLRTLGALEFLT